MPGKRGRPKIEIDLDEVRELASEGNTQADIAEALGFSLSTFKSREEVVKAYKLGMADLRVSLRHWQVNAAKDGNVNMLIWLGRNLLGQSDRIEIKETKQVEDDALTRSLEKIAEKMDGWDDD